MLWCRRISSKASHTKCLQSGNTAADAFEGMLYMLFITLRNVTHYQMLHVSIWTPILHLRVIYSTASGAVASAAEAVVAGHWVEPVCRCFCKGMIVRIGPPSDHPSKQGSNCCTLRVRDCAFLVVSATHRCTSTNLTQFSRSLLVLSQCTYSKSPSVVSEVVQSMSCGTDTAFLLYRMCVI